MMSLPLRYLPATLVGPGGIEPPHIRLKRPRFSVLATAYDFGAVDRYRTGYHLFERQGTRPLVLNGVATMAGFEPAITWLRTR